MVTFDHVRDLALALPETEKGLLAEHPRACFTTPHFDGYPAVLIQLERISLEELEEIVAEAWLAQAPKKLADAYVRARAGEGLGLP